MKKVICLLLAVMMLVGLCGCFEDDASNVALGEMNSQTPNEDTEKPVFSLGKIENNTYSNAFSGISCVLPEGWVFYTEKQILEMNNLTGEFLDEDVAEAIKNAAIVYDMVANCQADGSNMNINFEKIDEEQKNVDIKQVLESQVDTIKSSFQNMGYTDIYVVYQKISVSGKNFDALKITSKIQGIDYYATVFCFQKENYLTNVSVGSLYTDKNDTILSYFTVK